MELSTNATTIANSRYLIRDHDGNILETVPQMFRRVAHALAVVEKDYNATDIQVAKLEEQFYDAMYSFSFIPAGRTLANAGGPTKLVSNCIVLHIEDTMEDIFQTLKDAALLQKAGSGLGFPLHLMRPAGSVTKASYGTSSGPVSFLHLYNVAFGVVKQQNRHGANMAVMQVDHPDILEFIYCKKREGAIRNFNISVGLTDAFMLEVKEDHKTPWMCKWKDTKMLPRRITRDDNWNIKTITPVELTARQLFMEMIENSWQNGDPGFVALDAVNKCNPLPSKGRIEACNPCVTDEAWITTTEGPRQVKELIGVPFFVPSFMDNSVHLCPKGFFCTGIKRVYRVETKEGITIDVTSNHKFLTTRGWVPVSKLLVGEVLPMDTTHPKEWKGDGTMDEGYLCGLIMGDGYICNKQGVIEIWEKEDGSHLPMKAEVERIVGDTATWTYRVDRKELSMNRAAFYKLANRFGLVQGNKKPGPLIERASSAFYKGFLRGFFDTDGSVTINKENNGCSLRLSQADLPTLQVVQRMLIRLGIANKLRLCKEAGTKLLPDGKGGKKLYPVKKLYEINITKQSMKTFYDTVGFINSKKKGRLEESFAMRTRALCRDVWCVTISKVVELNDAQVFTTTVNSIQHAYGTHGIVSMNCAEQHLQDGDVCNLGSINLDKFVTTDRQVDYPRLKEITSIAVQLLDNVIDRTDHPVERVNHVFRSNRRVGLGIMGLGDMLLQLRIPYNSEEGRQTASKILETIQTAAEIKSTQLAATKGVFPSWSQSIFYPNRPRRNAALTSIAPTGTISMFSDCSSGIECLFAFAYYYKNILGGTVQLQYTNKHLEAILKERGLYTPSIIDKIISSGSLQHIPEIPEDIRRVFVGAMDMSAMDHVLMLAAAQKHVDNAISKTINAPHNATKEQVRDLFITAFSLGCKCCTVYRDGSRMEQVLELHSREMCPDCNSPLIKQEGCSLCKTCGYSKCSI